MINVMNDDNYGFIFSDITITDGTFIKKAKNMDGKLKLQNEIRFYTYIIDKKVGFCVPKLLEHTSDTLKLQFIANSSTLTDVIIQSNMLGYVRRIKQHLSSIHCLTMPISAEVLERDLQAELKTKVLRRFGEYEWSSYDLYNIITSVNGIRIRKLPVYCDIIYERLVVLLRERRHYSLIHGDVHLGNILLDEHGRMIFIDPRGHFGETMLFGLSEYDHAKLLFGLSGYSAFDNMSICNVETTVTEISGEKNCNLEIEFIRQHEHVFESDEFDETTILLCLSIWLANNSCFTSIRKKVTSLMIACYYCEKYICAKSSNK